MVNTFITHSDLKESLRNLDSRRLGKQRVEAYQMRNILANADAIVSMYKGYPAMPENEIERENWLKIVYTMYKKEKDGLVIDEKGNYFFESSNIKYVRKVQSGFYAHPMVAMWIGYQSGLEYYIDLCIIEWISRGYKNNMKLYNNDFAVLPWWVDCPAVHNSHKSALLRKERARNEKPWYWLKKDFTENIGEWLKMGFLWISHLNEEQRRELKNFNTVIDPSKFCDIIRNDFIE